MTFEEWWKSSSTSIHFYEGDDIIAKGAWQAATAAERERAMGLVNAMNLMIDTAEEGGWTNELSRPNKYL
jgi:hypothetical protein